MAQSGGKAHFTRGRPPLCCCHPDRARRRRSNLAGEDRADRYPSRPPLGRPRGRRRPQLVGPPLVVVTGLAVIFCRPLIPQQVIRPERLQYAGEGRLRAESLCVVPEVVGGHFADLLGVGLDPPWRTRRSVATASATCQVRVSGSKAAGSSLTAGPRSLTVQRETRRWRGVRGAALC